MKRLFIGIPINCESACSMVSTWQLDSRLNLNRLAWTKFSNWHITLVFLGALPESDVAILSPMIDAAFDNCLAYTTDLTGLGVFPGKRKPNVLWIGLKNTEHLLPGYQKLTTLLHENNFTLDPKPFNAHLTIARVKSLNAPRDFHTLVETHHDTSFGTVNIARITLYESVSSPGGITYLPLYEKDLKRETPQ